MASFNKKNNVLLYQNEQEEVTISFLSNEIVRVQATINYQYQFKNFAIDDKLIPIKVNITIDNELATLQSDTMRVEISKHNGVISFYKYNEKIPFLQEIISPRAYIHTGRMYKTLGGDDFSLEQTFISDDSEKFYGLGQHHHGYLDNKGITLDIEHRNSEIFIPVLVSNKQYGFLWNNPALGKLELSKHQTKWIADQTKQLDYCVFIGNDYAEIMNNYHQLTGFPTVMPEYAMGYWQCKLRYRTQEELLEVAREHKKRNIPLSVIVVDFFHWTKMGEWEFDPIYWPDPKAMVDELTAMGIKLMVSVWPTVNSNGKYTEEMLEKSYLLTTERNHNAIMHFSDVDYVGPKDSFYYDPYTKESREYLWNIIKKNYLDIGIEIFWLDACEPEFRPLHFDNVRSRIGSMKETGSLYPKLIQQAFYEGMIKDGVENPLNLCRSAWAGSQKYGAAVWSGDIDSTFQALKENINAGLNMAMSGIPWWTTDIGGFHGGDINDPEFQELVVRWFQYAVFCPICRMHGHRTDTTHDGIVEDMLDPKNSSGNPNEVWSFGKEVLEILTKQIQIRVDLKQYIKDVSILAHQKGTPMIKPLFFDFPEDQECYKENHQFMFGNDILVAPIVEYKARSRELYLPSGAEWKHFSTGEIYKGGQRITCDAPLSEIPIFIKNSKEIIT